MLVFSLCVSSFLICAAALQVVGVTNSLLDPLPLSSWKNGWLANAIDLSYNNLGQTGVTVNFYINLSTSLTNGVFEVTFPSGFSLGSVSGASGLVVQQVLTATAGTDVTVSITGVTNPTTTGPYGPFALRTRSVSTGQILDANLGFGAVYIIAAAGTLGQLSVALTSGSNAVNAFGGALSFTFTIGKSLWKHDMFRITVSQYWTIGSSAVCSSVTYSTHVNNFNGTNAANPHVLDCVASAKVPGQSQSLYIYGLAVDYIDININDNRYVNLVVSTVTAPDRNYPAAQYSWTVETMRFGTKTVLESASYSLGPATGPGAITSLTWKLTWSPPNFSIVSGYQAFTETGFTLTDAIPVGGSATLVYSDSVAISAWSGVSCYLLTYLSSTAVCTASSTTTISITGLPAMAAGAIISFRSYSLFSTAAGGNAVVNSVTTYDPSGYAIDTGTGLSSLAIAAATAAQLSGGLTVDFYDSSHTTLKNFAAGTGDQSLYLHFKITPTLPSDLVTSTTVTIYCPIATDTSSNFLIYIPSSNRVDEWKANNQGMNAGQTVFNSVSSANGSIVSLTTTTGNTIGQIQFIIGTNMLLGGTYLNASMHMTSGVITLPYVVNNAATAYECLLSLQDSTGTKKPQRYAKQFTIAPQSWSTSTFTYFCNINLAGAPVMFTLKPAVVNVFTSTSATYYIEFELSPYNAYYGSGMTEGGSYPVQTSLTAASTSMVIYSGGTNIIWTRLTGFGSLITTVSTINVMFPVGSLSAGTVVTAVVRSLFYLTADPRTKFITHQSSSLTYTTSATVAAFPSKSVTAGFSTTNGDSVSSVGLALSLQANSNLSAPSWLYFVFPAGFSWTSGQDIRSSNPSASSPFALRYFFTSPSASFAFPGVLVQQTNGGTSLTNAATTISIYGLRFALGVSTSTLYITAVNGASNGSLTATCDDVSTTDLTLTPSVGQVTSLTVTPNNILAQGPGGVDTQHTVSFTLTHGIPVGGSIVLAINSYWATTTCTTCTVSGLSNQSTTISVSCVWTATTFTIKNFADFSSTRTTYVSVVLAHLLPPAAPSTTGYAFINSLISYTAGGLKIDSFATTSPNVIVVAPLSTGTSKFLQKQTYPQTAGISPVDLYLQFSLAHSIPVCGTIAITSPLAWQLTSGDIRNVCFMSGVTYSSCTFAATGLAITLSSAYVAGAVLQLFLEAAVATPNVAGVSQTGFKVITSWFGAVIDTDGSSITSAQLFTTLPQVSTPVSYSTSGSLTFTPKNAGEHASYVFSFKSALDMAVGQQLWVKFPASYDYFLGTAVQTYSSQPGVYYIPCAFATFGSVPCTVDHRTLAATMTTLIPAGSSVSFTVFNVLNPGPTVTGYFQLYQVDATGNVLAASATFAQVTPIAAPVNLDIRSVEGTNQNLYATSDYGFQIYIYGTVDTNSQIQVLFPKEFDLSRMGVGALACSTSWEDFSSSAVSHAPQSWNSQTSCSLSGNVLTLPSPTASTVFSANAMIYMNYTGVTNPEYGQNRIAPKSTWDFDLTDSAVWSMYTKWTSKFQFFVFDASTNQKYSARSYSNLHSAYVGMNSAQKQLYVNSFTPQNLTGRVVLLAGTQTTDLLITTASAAFPCQSQSLTFTPSVSSATPDNGLISFSSSYDNFVMYQDATSIRFRISADEATPKGLYYVQWKIDEVKQTGVTTSPYDLPAQTLVEIVAAQQGYYQFQVAPVPVVQVGLTSIPIQVSVPNAPNANVTLSIGIVNAPANVNVQPQTLMFKPNINALSFQIIVSQNYDMLTGSKLNLTFSLSGTNADLYTIQSPIQFSVIEATLVTNGLILSWGLTTPTRTTVSFSPTANEAGLLYYFLSAQGTVLPSFSALRTRVQTEAAQLQALLLGNTTGYPVPSPKEMSPLSNETWSDFERRLYRNHLTSSWVGEVIVNPLVATGQINVTWLWAGTNYQIAGYLDNTQSSTPGSLVSQVNFSTTASADCQPFTLQFQGYVDNSLFTTIVTTFANYAGVNPARILQQTRFTSRRTDTSGATTVSSTSFTMTLLQNRYEETPDPSTQVALDNSALSGLQASLIAQGIPNTLQTMSLGLVPNRYFQQWKTFPTIGLVTSQSVTIVYACQIIGTTCCAALGTNTTYPSGEQVLLGLNAANVPVPYNCVNNDLSLTNNSATIAGLTYASQYYVFCSGTDVYPVFPTQMQYADSSQIQFLSVVTTGISTLTPGNTSLARVLGIGLSLWIALNS